MAGTAPWRHGSISTPILTGGAAYAVADLLNVAGVRPWPVAAAAVAGLLAAIIGGAAHGLRRWPLAYTVATTGVAGAWLTYTTATSPWTARAVAALAAATVLAGGCYPAYRYARRDHIAAAWARDDHQAATVLPSRRGHWRQILNQVGLTKVDVTGIDKARGGHTIHLALPIDGTITPATLQQMLPRLSVAAGRHLGLRSGALRLVPGDTDAEVDLHVTVEDVLAKLIPIPDEHGIRHARDPIPLGIAEDGAIARLPLDAHVAMVGITDAGKSNLINVIVSHLTRCDDVVVWMMDPKGGRAAIPWIRPWLDGQTTGQPALDWVGTTEAEWDRMCRAIEQAIDARASALIGGEKVTASPGTPRIVVVIDEVTDVLAARHRLAAVRAGVRKGRSEEIYFILLGQRGTVTMFGDGDLKSQIRYWIGLAVAKAADALLIFPDDPHVVRQLPKIQHRGAFFYKAHTAAPLPVKGYRIEPDQVQAHAAAHCDGRRPALDEVTAAALTDYAGRWSTARAGHLHRTRAGASAQASVDPTPTTPAHPADARPTGGMVRIASFDELLARAAARDAAKRGDDAEPGSDGPITPAEVERILGTIRRLPEPDYQPEPAPAVDARKTRMVQLILEAGPSGIAVADLAEALAGEPRPPSRGTLRNWLTAATSAGMIRRIGHGRYGAPDAP